MKRIARLVIACLLSALIYPGYEAIGQIAGHHLLLDSLFRDKGEVSFCVQVDSYKEIPIISSLISIARVEGKTVHAFANRHELSRFLDLGYDPVFYQVHIPDDLTMSDYSSVRQNYEWDSYPTYDAYIGRMFQFEDDYPDLCRIETIGTLPSGRKLLAARISDQVDLQEGEPQFLYTSSMHGNETGGYVLMLRLIDHLLSLYGTDPDITWLVDNLEIFINPLANPDGTYAGGNNTIAGATRGNANNVDLNRNYPDPEDGPHPDGNPWQPETLAFMEFANTHDIVMGANFHSGNELVNYPWDTWAQRHADDDWWMFVSYEYADTVHAHSNGYFYGQGTGVTNGYDWYTISGGRQDYMTYFHNGRECTIEISDEFIYPASQLPVLWEYNYRSFLNYMRQCAFGISGTITDAATGDPIMARIVIDGHDTDSSHVYSSLPAGNYHRLIHEGTYTLEIKSPGYFPVSIPDVNVVNYQKTELNVQMTTGDLIADFSAGDRSVPAGGSVQFTDESYGDILTWSWVFEGGIPAISPEQHPAVTYPQAGLYTVSLTVSDGISSNTIERTAYILVSVEFLMQNGEYSTCSGMFFDSGGEGGNYGNNQNMVMTFYPDAPGKKLAFNFIYFSVEDHPSCDYDWLRIYDGPAITSPMIGEYCGSEGPGSIAATNDEGALTFRFHSDAMVTSAGWVAEISCDVSTDDNVSIHTGIPVRVFPNPAGDHLIFRFAEPVPGPVQYNLYTASGALVLRGEMSEVNEKQIDTQSLHQGIYVLEIFSQQSRIFRKIMVQ